MFQNFNKFIVIEMDALDLTDVLYNFSFQVKKHPFSMEERRCFVRLVFKLPLVAA